MLEMSMQNILGVLHEEVIGIVGEWLLLGFCFGFVWTGMGTS